MIKHRLALLILVGCAVAASAQPQKVAGPTFVPRPERKTGVEIMARFKDQPTEIARTSSGRIFCVLYDAIADKSRLVEIKKDGSSVPYPDQNWNNGRNPDGTGFSEIVALKAGNNNEWLGIVDAGSASYSPRLLLFDTAANKLIGTKELSSSKREAGSQKFAQDLAIDVPHRCIYLVGTSPDRKTATLIVFDVKNDNVRTFTILKGKTEGSPSPASGTSEKDTASLRRGMNIPIAIDPNYEWLYLGGIGGDEIFRVRTELLADPSLTTDLLLKSVELYGQKEICTHFAADALGNVYCAEDTRNRIGIFSADRHYRTFAQDAILNYPYAIALGKDGYLYISVNQVRRLQETGNTTVDANHPFLIARVRTLQ